MAIKASFTKISFSPAVLCYFHHCYWYRSVYDSHWITSHRAFLHIILSYFSLTIHYTHVQWHVIPLQTGTLPDCFNCQLRFCFWENHIYRVALSFSLISCWGVYMNKYLILIFIVLRQFKCTLNVTTTCINLQQHKPTFSKFHVYKLCFSTTDVKITNKFPHSKFWKFPSSIATYKKSFGSKKVKSCLHWVHDRTMDISCTCLCWCIQTTYI